jgi:hypothetical protein
MASVNWETTRTMNCERLGSEVALLEKRVYPSDYLNTAFAGFHKEGVCCSHGIECNLAGLKCRYSGLTPDYDPFLD